MKLHELVSPIVTVLDYEAKKVRLVELSDYEVRKRQVRKLKLALAQAPDKATKRRLEREIARQEVLAQDGGTVEVHDYLEGVPF